MSLALVNESAGFVPTRKFHLATDNRAAALCGAAPSAIVWNVSVRDRVEFERLCLDRICKRCLAVEKS